MLGRRGYNLYSSYRPPCVYTMAEFAELYRKHVNAVFRFSLRCVGRRDIAEEITSEAFLALYRNLEGIDENRLPAWLLTVAKHRAVDYWRRCTVEQRYADHSLHGDPAVSAEPPLENWLLESKALKPVHRVCVFLRYAYGMSRAEIAQQTGLTETQIKGHLQYALQLLRKELVKAPREGAT